MSPLALTLRQFRYENKAFWRNPASAFFTFAFPLMFLVIFSLLFGNDTIDIFGEETRMMTFYVPAITAFSVITACYTNIAISMVFLREEGVLKRKRGTPLPAGVFLGGRILHAVFVAILLVLIVLAAGVLFYDVTPPDNTIVAFVVMLVVGAATFCALGVAVTALVPNQDAAPPLVNFSILPLLFISDIFIPTEDAPEWLTFVADLFPVRHYSQAILATFDPARSGSGLEWDDLAVVAAWGVAGVVVAIRYFHWEPSR